MRNKVLSIFLITVILFASLAKSDLFAREESPEISELSTSYMSGNQLTFSIVNKIMKITSLPEDVDFDRLGIWLLDEAGTSHLKIYYSRQELLSGEKTIDLNTLAIGTYYLQVYPKLSGSNAYRSYIWKKDVAIHIDETAAMFETSPVYKNNVEEFYPKRTDQLARNYYLEAGYWVESEDPAIIDLAKSITSGLNNDYDKAKAIHDWVCSNIYYDYDFIYDYNSYNLTTSLLVLQSRKTICEGYANLTAALLRASGLPTKVVYGYGIGDEGWTDNIIDNYGSNHTWNEVFVENRWLIMDTTWDTNNRYSEGQFSSGTGINGYRYFDPSIEFFSYTHKIAYYTEENIPTLYASPTTSNLLVNGQMRTVDAYNIDGNNYMKLRDLATLINETDKQFEVIWDGDKNAISLRSHTSYTSVGGELKPGTQNKKIANKTSSMIYIDGKLVNLTAYLIGGNNYFKLRDVMQAFDVGVKWDDSTRTISIDTNQSYTVK